MGNVALAQGLHRSGPQAQNLGIGPSAGWVEALGLGFMVRLGLRRLG